MKSNIKFHFSKITCLFLIFTLSPLCSFAQFGGFGQTANLNNVSEKWLDVDYAGDGLQGHKMDIYLPSDANAPYPLIVTIGGSAWFSNNVKQAAIGRCGPLLDKGFAVVAVNHRSSSDAKFPAQINDIKGAVRFLRANASKYKLDPNFIGIMGDSSGGHLAALMGTSGSVGQYTIGEKTVNIEGDIGDNLKESSSVDAVVDLFGPTIFYRMNSQRVSGGMDHDGANSPESSLIGAPIQQNHELCDLASPLTYIDSNDPPFLIIHGDRDALVPLGQSILLRDALTEKEVKNEMFTVENAGHEDAKIWSKEYMDKIIEFFTRQKNKKSEKE